MIMIPITDVIKIGEKYYLNTDVQKVLEARIQSIPEEQIDL